MWKNYLTLAVRNLVKNKIYSLINIAGLGLGLAACMLILLWVTDELSFDRWNEKAGQIYRAEVSASFGGNSFQGAVSPGPMAQALISDFPEVEAVARFWNMGTALVRTGAETFKESGVVYGDSSLFKVFSLRMVQGDPETALAVPDGVVLTETMARKYFPGKNPVGQTLLFDGESQMRVTGVIADVPKNTHFTINMIRSLSGEEYSRDPNWLSNNFLTYLVLRAGTSYPDFEKKMNAHLLKTYVGPQAEQVLGQSMDELLKAGTYVKFNLTPLTRIHLHSNKIAELGPNGNAQYVWLFSLAAFFILTIAVVNFINLATARSALRAKEIGIRKVVGSQRHALIQQFLGESVLMVLLATVFALLLAQLLMPAYNQITGKTMNLPAGSWQFWAALSASVAVTGFAAGIYPAFFLSGFQPILVLKGRFSDSLKGRKLRSALVVFQFFIACTLIFCSIVIRQQIAYIQNKQLGFDRNQVIVINDAYALDANIEVFKDQVKSIPNVINATVSGFLPVKSNRSDSPVCKVPEVRQDQCVLSQHWRVDDQYIPTLGMEIIRGRNFDAGRPADSLAVILNERAAQMLFPDKDPIGQDVYSAETFDQAGDVVTLPYKVIGVVKDFNYESLRDQVSPLTLFLRPNSDYISIRVNGKNLPATIARLEKYWKDLAPGVPFSFEFLDTRFDAMYRTEIRVGQISNIFSFLSILIACLGLFGLATFTAERRTKEIGIRKVMGASTGSVVLLLSRDLLRLVLISLIFAIPVSWWAMNAWLKNFAYHIEVQWWVLLAVSALAVAVAFLTVSIQGLRAALMDPVKSLRTE